MKDLLAARATQESTVKWTFQGTRVCLRSWKKLHGFGASVLNYWSKYSIIFFGFPQMTKCQIAKMMKDT